MRTAFRWQKIKTAGRVFATSSMWQKRVGGDGEEAANSRQGWWLEGYWVTTEVSRGRKAELPTLCSTSSKRPLSTHMALVVTLIWALSCDGRTADDTSAAEEEEWS